MELIVQPDANHFRLRTACTGEMISACARLHGERRRAGAKQDGANPHASPNHDKGEEAGDNDPVMAGPNLVTVNRELQSRPCIEGNSHQRDLHLSQRSS